MAPSSHVSQALEPPLFPGRFRIRDPNEDDRVWVVFDWDDKGWESFVSDPEVPAIMKEAGHKGRPQAAKLGGQYNA